MHTTDCKAAALERKNWPQNTWGSHDFDSVRFPDPERMIDNVHAMDARILVHDKKYESKVESGWQSRCHYSPSLRNVIKLFNNCLKGRT
ncbi:MAG: hypothetical protein LBL94_08585 [Prevotellaceae bacterium]|nr:hypothetical protein [Prevotellaceae bacterium]